MSGSTRYCRSGTWRSGTRRCRWIRWGTWQCRWIRRTWGTWRRCWIRSSGTVIERRHPDSLGRSFCFLAALRCLWFFLWRVFFISILRILLVLLRAFGLKLPGNRQNRGHQKSRFTNPGSLGVRRWRRRCRRCCLRGRSTLRCCRCGRTPQPSHQRLRTML